MYSPFRKIHLYVFIVYIFSSLTSGKAQNQEDNFTIYYSLATKYQDSLADSMLYYSEKALEYAQEMDDAINQAKSLELIATYYKDEPEKAISQLREAANFYTSEKQLSEAGDMFRKMSIISEQLSLYDSAIAQIDKGILLLEECRDSAMLASAWLSRGIYFEALGNYQQALKDKLFALKINELIKDEEGIASALNNIGVLYFYMSDYENAVQYILQSVRKKEALGLKKNLPSGYLNIGGIYQMMDDYDHALESYQKALSIARELNDSYYMCASLNNSGLILQEQKKLHEALETFREAMNIAKKHSHLRNLYVTLGNMGLIYADLGQYKEAIYYYEQALELKKESGDAREAAKTMVNIGELLLKQNKYNAAIKKLKDGLKTAEGINDIRTSYEAHAGLADAYKKSGQYALALQHIESFIQLKDSVYQEDAREEIAELQTRFETEKKEAQITQLEQQKEISDLKIGKQQSDLKAQQIIFTGIAIAFIMVLLIGLLLFNRYKLKQKHVHSLLEKKALEIEQRLLRTQINPHFIFNSLNSIQSFISQNDTFTGISYLSKFARLMRLILENSRKAYAPFDDELESLRLNLELEKMRFNQRFDFEIEVDSTIETEELLVPPMIAQPFIENAVLHAFTEKKDSGLISIHYHLNDKILRCTIEDNGLGRKAAMENKQKSSGHTSLGMQLTEERLDLLKKNTGQNAFAEIIDLYDSNNKACGTKVIIDLPYKWG